MDDEPYRLNDRPSMRSGLRLLLAGAMIVGAGLVLQARGRSEVFQPRLALQSFPVRLGPWVARDIPMDKEVLDVLGPGDFLLRVYQPRDSGLPPVDLFIAYFAPSALVTPSTHPNTAFLELDGCR